MLSLSTARCHEEVTATPLPGLVRRLLRYAGRSLLGLGQGRCWPYSQIPQPGIFWYINIHKWKKTYTHTEGICRSMVGPRHRLTVFFSKSLLHLFLNFPPLLPICFLHTHFLCCTFSDFCGDNQHLWITCKICKKHSLKN